MMNAFLLISKQTFVVSQDVFSVALFVFQDLLKMSSRRLQDVFAIRFPKTSLRRLQYIFKTSSRRFQDVCKTCLEDVLQLCLQDVFKTSWKTKKCYTEDVLKRPWRRLQYVFTKTNVCWDWCRSMLNSAVLTYVCQSIYVHKIDQAWIVLLNWLAIYLC